MKIEELINKIIECNNKDEYGIFKMETFGEYKILFMDFSVSSIFYTRKYNRTENDYIPEIDDKSEIEFSCDGYESFIVLDNSYNNDIMKSYQYYDELFIVKTIYDYNCEAMGNRIIGYFKKVGDELIQDNEYDNDDLYDYNNIVLNLLNNTSENYTINYADVENNKMLNDMLEEYINRSL